MKRLKFQIVVVFDLDASVHDFWEFYKVESESGFGPETSFHPYDLFFRHTNLQKKINVGRHLFQRSKPS
jgi:hypothetical protein